MTEPKLNDEQIVQIVENALALREQHSQETLYTLLEATQIREQSFGNDRLGSPKELASAALEFVGNRFLRDYRLVTSAVLNPFIVRTVIEFLTAKNLIDPANISRDTFIIALVTAIVMEGIYKKWKELHPEK